MDRQEQPIHEDTRLRAIAFVCPQCEVCDSTLDGYALFYDIYVHNFGYCRYLVAERGSGEFLVLDMWDDAISAWSALAPLIDKLSVHTYMSFPTEEAALMAAATLPQ